MLSWRLTDDNANLVGITLTPNGHLNWTPESAVIREPINVIVASANSDHEYLLTFHVNFIQPSFSIQLENPENRQINYGDLLKLRGRVSFDDSISSGQAAAVRTQLVNARNEVLWTTAILVNNFTFEKYLLLPFNAMHGGGYRLVGS
jgi:hypothetical protein